jgi:hypothetical protein
MNPGTLKLIRSDNGEISDYFNAIEVELYQINESTKLIENGARSTFQIDNIVDAIKTQKSDSAKKIGRDYFQMPTSSTLPNISYGMCELIEDTFFEYKIDIREVLDALKDRDIKVAKDDTATLEFIKEAVVLANSELQFLSIDAATHYLFSICAMNSKTLKVIRDPNTNLEAIARDAFNLEHNLPREEA